jgi:hypothetical protein
MTATKSFSAVLDWAPMPVATVDDIRCRRALIAVSLQGDDLSMEFTNGQIYLARTGRRILGYRRLILRPTTDRPCLSIPIDS